MPEGGVLGRRPSDALPSLVHAGSDVGGEADFGGSRAEPMAGWGPATSSFPPMSLPSPSPGRLCTSEIPVDRTSGRRWAPPDIHINILSPDQGNPLPSVCGIAQTMPGGAIKYLYPTGKANTKGPSTLQRPSPAAYPEQLQGRESGTQNRGECLEHNAVSSCAARPTTCGGEHETDRLWGNGAALVGHGPQGTRTGPRLQAAIPANELAGSTSTSATRGEC